MGKGSRRWQRKHGKEKRKPSAPHKPVSKPMRWAAEEDQQFRKEFSFFYTRAFKLFLLGLVVLGVFMVRFSSTQAQALTVFQGDDEYWHLHVLNQMVKLGYRPSIDYQAWVPSGRPMVHPPLYHYLIYGICRLFNSNPFDVMFYSGAFIAVLGVLGWFLLCRELYENNWFAGLMGASIYAVLPITVAPTTVGSARPQALAEVLMPFALWLFLYATRTGKKWMYALPGVLLGVLSLIWESSIYLYFSLVALFWVASIVGKKASKRLHLLSFLTLSIAIAIAMSYYLPIYMQFGIWENTPGFMLKSTFTFWRPDLLSLLYGQLVVNHVFYIISIIAFPLLLLYAIAERESLPCESFALTFMGLGLIGTFFLGMRIIGATLGFGIILTFTSTLEKGWRNPILLRTQRGHALFAGCLCVLLTVSAAYTAYCTASEFIPYYETVSLTSLRGKIGKDVPRNSTVICPLRDAAFLLGHGLRTPWDAYLEHMPLWTKERTGKIVSVFLAKNEDEALKLMKEFDADYLLVRYELTYPEEFQLLLEAVGVNDDPYQYFNFTAIKETRPKLLLDPNTGKPVIPIQVSGYEDVVLGYEFAPQPKGRQFLLSSLIWNKDANTFKTDIPLPPIPQHFKLVWKSSDGMVLLYKVVGK